MKSGAGFFAEMERPSSASPADSALCLRLLRELPAALTCWISDGTVAKLSSFQGLSHFHEVPHPLLYLHYLSQSCGGYYPQLNPKHITAPPAAWSWLLPAVWVRGHTRAADEQSAASIVFLPAHLLCLLFTGKEVLSSGILWGFLFLHFLIKKTSQYIIFIFNCLFCEYAVQRTSDSTHIYVVLIMGLQLN